MPRGTGSTAAIGVEPHASGARLAAMLRSATLLLVVLVLAACGGTANPTSTPSPSPSPTPAPTIDTSIFLPLPGHLSGLAPGGGPSASIESQTQRGLTADPTLGHPFELGHCGLMGPVDFDGSLWDPSGGHNGRGGPLSDDQVGELINATPVRIFLLDPATALLVTPGNAFALLSRHDGAREYGLCD
jgi:hypothetical protein